MHPRQDLHRSFEKEISDIITSKLGEQVREAFAGVMQTAVTEIFDLGVAHRPGL